MRAILYILFCCSLQFAGSAIAAGQQKPAPAAAAPLAADAPLAETLRWLESRLVRSGTFRYYDPFGPYEHKYYDRSFEYLRSEGCVIRYRYKEMRRGEEYSVDLTKLDPTQVKADIPKGWKGGRVVFVSVAGKNAVTSPSFWGRAQRENTSEFALSDPEALEGIAEALRRAILLCRN